LNRLCLVASRDGREKSVTVHQHVDLYASVLEANKTIEHVVDDGRKIFVQIVSGDVVVNGHPVTAGDGVQITNEKLLSVASHSEAEFLVFDMA